jgi:molecular chaperone DnaK
LLTFSEDCRFTVTDIVVGIDLGTTFSAIAWVNEAGVVEVIPNREGSNTTPSVVLAGEQSFVVGQEALNQAIARPNDVAQCIKRLMGDESFRFQDRYRPEEISAEILRKLVHDAQQHLNQEINRAVITVPAYFTATPLAKTKAAGELAGLTVEDLLHEPEAAAIHFGVEQLGEGQRVLVCDLGGGTYDATVLLMQSGTLQAEKTRGSYKLGGHDWTERLMTLLAEEVVAQGGDDPCDDLATRQRLYDLAEATKRQLSQVEQTTVAWIGRGGTLQIGITREGFEERCAPLLDEVLDKTSEAVTSAGLTMAAIDHVLLVGGSSRLPSFARALEGFAGKPVKKTRNPDEAVARGAALVAKGIANAGKTKPMGRITVSTGPRGAGGRIVVQRRTSHALGTLVYRRNGRDIEYVYERVIEENSNLPAEMEKTGYRVEPGQRSFQIPILQLDSYNQEQERLGNFRFSGIAQRKSEAEIRIRFEYDASGLPKVSAFDVATGQELEREIVDFLEPTLTESSGAATVVLAIDCSASMSGSKMDQAKRVLTELAEKYVELGRNWSISVINFGGPGSIYPSQIILPPTNELDQIRTAADRLDAGGGTPMEAGLDNVRDVLEAVSGTRLAVIITDGQPWNTALCRSRAQTLQALNIRIATVPIGDDADRDFLRSIGDLESDIHVDGAGRGMSDAVIDLLKKI